MKDFSELTHAAQRVINGFTSCVQYNDTQGLAAASEAFAEFANRLAFELTAMSAELDQAKQALAELKKKP